MGQIWIREFTGGLDTRRLPVTTAGGVLIRAQDGHITRGGEFEKRQAFVPVYRLPPGTVGTAAGKSSIYVFGHTEAPSLPSGVSYQRLQHSNGATALSRVLSYDLYGGKLYVVGEFADGSIFHFFDGVRVDDWFDGRARASFRVVSGGGTSQVTDIKIDGISIISSAVTYTTSNSVTAGLLAAAINSFSSSPDYTATAVDDTVNIVASVVGTAPNGRAVTFTLTNAFTISPGTGLAMAGGADTDTDFVPGTFVKTIGSRVHSVSGPNEHFSGIAQPTKFTTDTTGAGFIDMSTQASGSEELTSLAKYQQFVAVFAERIIQIWYFDSDPNLNTQKQVLNNTGTASPRSVTQFGDNDLFYLDESGLRSLRARDSSNAAATTDIGVPIDSLVVEKLAALTPTERQQVYGFINPADGRFWLCMLDTVFVFSFFSGAKISAWTTYVPAEVIDGVSAPFNIEEAAVFRRKVYVRSGDTIYAYGGLGATPVYDATEAEAWLPYLNGESPAKKKRIDGVDAAVLGTWEIRVALDPTDEAVSDLVANVVRSTFDDERVSSAGEATHMSLRFKSKGVGPAILGSAVIHFTAEEDAS